MIIGSVNDRFEITLTFKIRDSVGILHEFGALLDTGFSGSLTLPPPVIAVLGLPWDSQTDGTLANGQPHRFDMHDATIIWDGVTCQILVQASECVPLLGSELLKGYDLRVRFADGGLVELEKIP